MKAGPFYLAFCAGVGLFVTVWLAIIVLVAKDISKMITWKGFLGALAGAVITVTIGHLTIKAFSYLQWSRW